MGATKKYLIQMREKEYISINEDTRHRFISEKVIYDDYDVYKDNDTFIQLYKEKKKATKNLDDWKFNQRHNYKR